MRLGDKEIGSRWDTSLRKCVASKIPIPDGVGIFFLSFLSRSHRSAWEHFF